MVLVHSQVLATCKTCCSTTHPHKSLHPHPRHWDVGVWLLSFAINAVATLTLSNYYIDTIITIIHIFLSTTTAIAAINIAAATKFTTA